MISIVFPRVLSSADWIEAKRIVLQTIPFLLILGIGGLLSGVLLENYLDYIHLVPGVFVLIPALMNLRGAVESALAARLGTAYHLGLIKRRGFFGDEVKQNFFGSLALAALLAVANGVFAFFVAQSFGLEGVSLPFLLVLSLVASVIGAVVLGFATIAIILLAASARLDPDNISIPLVTTLGDVLMVAIVFVLIVLMT